MVNHPGQIIYNSDLIIRSPAELATLCTFYDKVLLPYTSPETSHLFAGARTCDVNLPTGYHEEGERQFIFDVPYWQEIYGVLMEENVVERLPPPSWGDVSPSRLLRKLKPTKRLDLITKAPSRVQIMIGNEPFGDEDAEEDLKKGVFKEELIKQDLALHLLRQDLEIPQLFINDSDRPSRDFLIGIEAKVAFSYLLPSLGYLGPDEILEVRNKVRDTREGFSLHLQKLSKGVDDKLKGGESTSEIESWAKRAIETELIPDYREFKRQIEAEKAGFWKKVLDVAGKAFAIDAAPWTPKFYGELLKALGITVLTYSAEQKERLSNKSQAFQFMSFVEGTFE
jgi:hypothetical protein